MFGLPPIHNFAGQIDQGRFHFVAPDLDADAIGAAWTDSVERGGMAYLSIADATLFDETRADETVHDAVDRLGRKRDVPRDVRLGCQSGTAKA